MNPTTAPPAASFFVRVTKLFKTAQMIYAPLRIDWWWRSGDLSPTESREEASNPWRFASGPRPNALMTDFRFLLICHFHHTSSNTRSLKCVFLKWAYLSASRVSHLLWYKAVPPPSHPPHLHHILHPPSHPIPPTMPEIAEVARIVHYIRTHLIGKTLSSVQALDDTSVFGKAGTTAAAFQSALTGKKILGAGQQGKYFWIEMSSPPHPVMHFGMTGWLKLSNEETYYYRSKEETAAWPPKFWKFIMETKEEPQIQAAFVDSRRFGRVRLVDCERGDIRKVSPLKENGPDPVVDKELVTEAWVVDLLKRKRIPIKALLLDQGNISGIGNWVGYVSTPPSPRPTQNPLYTSIKHIKYLTRMSQRRNPLPRQDPPRTTQQHALGSPNVPAPQINPLHLQHRRRPPRRL
jgi:formamidopyrimidine-DNA glycosylase